MAFSSLEIGKRGLVTSKIALDTTGNNIANVNTEGYSRRVVTTSETDPHTAGGGFVGTGVLIDKIRNFREDFFDREIRSSLSRQSGFDNDSKILKRVEAILAEPSDLGMNEIVSEFFNAFETLAQKPEDISLRANLLQLSENMVERFHVAAKQIIDLKAEIANSTNVNVDEANRLMKEIASLNSEVQKAIAYDGVGAQTYVDQREQKLEELSKYFEINVTNGDFGTINVFVNGMNIITGNITTDLKVKEKVNSSTAERTLHLVKTNNLNNDIPIKVNEGEIGSMLNHYNKTLNSFASVEDFSILRNLDEFANAIVNRVNNLTISGYGLNDKTAPPPGRAFFEPAFGKATASTIEISDDIKAKPMDIPFSANPNEPGDSEIARKIAKLSLDENFLGNQTPSEYYTNTIGQLGMFSKTSASGSETTAIVSEQLINQRESVIGVNLDEEAINLIKYQKSFEAASRVINETSSMLTTLINLGR